MPKSKLKIEGLQLSDIESLQATKTRLSIGIVNGVKVPSFIQEVVSPSLRVASSLQTDEVEYDTYVKWAITKAVQPATWAKAYGGTSTDKSWGVAVADNGDIIVAGRSNSFGNSSDYIWVLRLDENGNIVWQKAYGGTSDDLAYSVALASNGDIIVAGGTESFGAGIGSSDFIVLRLGEDGSLPVSELSVMDTNATVAPASCNVVDTNCTVTDISLTVTDTDCIVTETDCVVTEL